MWPPVLLHYEKKLIVPTIRGFLLRSDQIRNNLVPKYYDPELDDYLLSLSKTHDLLAIKSLFGSKALSIETGIEIGKMVMEQVPYICTHFRPVELEIKAISNTV